MHSSQVSSNYNVKQPESQYSWWWLVCGGLDVGNEDVWMIQLQCVQNLIAILLQLYQALNIILCVAE
jgi:hypothetical protein